MNLLAQLLPGVREIRAALVSGVAWILAGLIAIRGDLDLLRSQPIIGDISAIMSKYHVTLAATATAAYLLGSITVDVAKGLARRIPFGSVSRRANAMFRSRIEGALQAGNVPDNWIATVRFTMFRRQLLDVGSLELRSNFPDQYDTLDRQDAEADLRLGLVPPLVAAGLAVGWRISWLWAVVVFLASVGVAVHGWTYMRRRSSLLVESYGLFNIGRIPALNLWGRVQEKVVNQLAGKPLEGLPLAASLYAVHLPYLRKGQLRKVRDKLSRQGQVCGDKIAEEARTNLAGASPWLMPRPQSPPE